jgi:hypothetical protein
VRALGHVVVAVIILLSIVSPRTGAPSPHRAETAKSFIARVTGRFGSEMRAGAGIIVGYDARYLYVATANHIVRWGLSVAHDVQVQLAGLPGQTLGAEVMPQSNAGIDLAVLRVPNVKDAAVGALSFRRWAIRPPWPAGIRSSVSASRMAAPGAST